MTALTRVKSLKWDTTGRPANESGVNYTGSYYTDDLSTLPLLGRTAWRSRRDHHSLPTLRDSIDFAAQMANMSALCLRAERKKLSEICKVFCQKLTDSSLSGVR